MKRLLCTLVVLSLALSLAACTETTADVSSADLPSSQEVESETPGLPEYDSDGFVLIDNVRANRELTLGDDATRCFYEDAPGYVIESGPIQVDAETLRRVVKMPCRGNGSLIWRDYTKYANGGGDDHFDGIIPVSRINDPILLSMCMPSEGRTFMISRNNGQSMAVAPDNGTRLLSIGAIYPNRELEMDDSESFTFCLGRISLCVRTEGNDWELVDDHPFPPQPNCLYWLPWELEKKIGHGTLPAEQVNKLDDHVEITMTGADFNGVAARAKGASGAVLHFWGSRTAVNGPETLGLLVAYTAWLKDPAQEGRLLATIGADWYTNSKYIGQAFSGYNYMLTGTPRTLIGHTVGPKAYETVMDSERVQQLIGLK